MDIIQHVIALVILAFIFAWTATYLEYRNEYKGRQRDKSFLEWLGWR